MNWFGWLGGDQHPRWTPPEAVDGSPIHVQDPETTQLDQVTFIALAIPLRCDSVTDCCSSLAEIEASEIDILSRPARSNPVNVNMPETSEIPIQGLPVITGEGSASTSNAKYQHQLFLSNTWDS